MRKPVLTIFYQFNPWHATIGGIQTIVNTFIKYAPDDFEVRFVGTGHGLNESIGKWQETELSGRAVHFLPLFTVENDNVRKLVPTTLKYAVALLGRNFSSDFIHFHRLEPTLAALPWQGDKTLFIHNDIKKQMAAGGDKNAILWRRFPAAYFALERSLIGQFTQIFSCNTDSAELYRQRYPEIADRVSYLKNPFDGEIFYPLSETAREKERCLLAQKLGLPEATRFVLFAGRLHPQKDPLLLVRSMAALNEPNVHLLIAGDGELAEKVGAEISRLNLSQQVTMLGSVVQAELAELHRVCSAFVLTSAYEGLPLVVLEALACGTPVVTTECGETPRLLAANSGVVSQQRTPEAIADALRQILCHPDAYPSEACVRTAQPYSARAVIKEVYSEMLGRWQQRTHSPVFPASPCPIGDESV